MGFEMRRVVTGHDEQGRSTVIIDDKMTNQISKRPGHAASVVWTNVGFPASNDGSDDPSAAPIGTTIENGAIFRIISFDPGVAPRIHRTDSIDYSIVISGEIDLVLDTETVHVKAGDTIVQRGTIHNWINNGKVPCVIAFVLVAAKPVTAGGGALAATG